MYTFRDQGNASGFEDDKGQPQPLKVASCVGIAHSAVRHLSKKCLTTLFLQLAPGRLFQLHRRIIDLAPIDLLVFSRHLGPRAQPQR